MWRDGRDGPGAAAGLCGAAHGRLTSAVRRPAAVAQLKRVLSIILQPRGGDGSRHSLDGSSYGNSSTFNGLSTPTTPARGGRPSLKGLQRSNSITSVASNDDSVRGGFGHGRLHVRLRPRIIAPTDLYWGYWRQLILLLSLYSSLATPFEFAFWRRLPTALSWIDIGINFFFLTDLVLHFFVAYKDRRTYVLVDDRKKIALRYLRTSFCIDLLALLPWDNMYKATDGGAGEILRWMIWLRLYRLRWVEVFFLGLEKDIRFNYFVVRIVKLLIVELFATHVAGCFFYYLATTIPSRSETDTWIGSLTLGGNSYAGFRDINLWKRYITSLYWAIVTMATLGYGDIHPVNPREMIFACIFISCDMVLGAYLLGNITALVVKGSNTERYRTKMSALIKYMNRYHIPRGLRHQMRRHIRLQFETNQVADDIVEDFPIGIRHRIAHARFQNVVHECQLFQNCSFEFIDQIVSRVEAEYYMPGELVVQQRDAPHSLFIICYGVLEVVSARDGAEEIVTDLYAGQTVGEIAVLCQLPQEWCSTAEVDNFIAGVAQPFSVRVKELCQVLRVSKQSLTNVVSTYFLDGRQLVENLLNKVKGDATKLSTLASDIQTAMAQQEAELVMTTINCASRGDTEQLRQLIKAGADPSKQDYDGRTSLVGCLPPNPGDVPVEAGKSHDDCLTFLHPSKWSGSVSFWAVVPVQHLAASKGFKDMVAFLLLEGVDINAKDNFGTTPLLEALRSNHDETARLLVEKGATVSLTEAGSDLCNAVINGNIGYLQRLLDNGVDPNSADYDMRTPLHIAAAEGFFLVVRLLVNSGADVTARDRWGHTPLDEARTCGSQPIVQMLENVLRNRGATEQEIEGPEKQPDVAPAVSKGNASEVSELQDKLAALSETSPTLPLVRTTATPEAGPTRTSSRPPSVPGSPRGVRGGLRGSNRLSGESTRKRITIYPYHPMSSERKAGRLVFLPGSIQELLQLAAQHFGGERTRVLNSDNGEIDTIDLIFDGDRLYVCGSIDPLAPQPATE
eukprot:SM000099S25200  [mRNA]  locus=s99:136265:141912:+ [translate_table: standard]